MDAIEERLHDPKKLEKLRITELTGLLLRLEHAKPASNGTEPKDEEKDITIVEPDQFDAVLDGLEDEKKFARQVGVGSTGSDGGSVVADGAADCSTGSVKSGACSV